MYNTIIIGHALYNRKKKVCTKYMLETSLANKEDAK